MAGEHDIVPDNATIEALLQNEDKGPLKPLAEADAEDQESGTDEATRLEAAEEAPAEDDAPEGEEPEPTDDGKTNDEVLADVREVLKALDEDEKKEPEKPKAEEAGDEPDLENAPADLKALLEHDDPAVVEYAKAEIQRRADLDSRIAKIEQRAFTEQAAVFESAVESAAAACNPPLTPIEMEWVVDRMTEQKNGTPPMMRTLMKAAADKAGGDPNKLASLTVRAGIERLIPGRLKAAPAKADTGAKKAPEGSRPVIRVTADRSEKGTVDTRGGSAGPKPTLTAPPENESLEAAIARGMKRLWR